jgi:hypothetical protein
LLQGSDQIGKTRNQSLDNSAGAEGEKCALNPENMVKNNLWRPYEKN